MCIRSQTAYTPCNHIVSRVTEPCDSPGSGCGTTTSGAPSATPSSSTDCPTCKELKDEEVSILAELEAAIAANPDLKAEKPKSAAPQWEDYEAAIANNPDFAAPVAATNREKKYYSLKEKWECGHEGTPYQTAIERDGGDDDKDALLISDIKGICPACMDKWTKLEEGAEDVAGGSGGPPGLPTYNQTWSDDGKDTGKDKGPGDISDDELPSARTRFGRETNLDEHDESPSKGKGHANLPAGAGTGADERSKSPAPYSDYGDDAGSITGSDLSDTPAKPKKHVRIYDSGDSDSDNPGKGKPKSKNGSKFDDDSEDDYSDDLSFSGSDTNENVKKKRRAFFKLGTK